ncbi:MAG: hypothetical protein AAF267_15590 [Deinococcota bacterium]
MNKSALYDLLEAADNVDGDVYAPSTLTSEAYLELEQKIQLVKQEVEALIGKELDEWYPQDSSSMASLSVYRRVVAPGRLGLTLQTEFNITFFNFFSFVIVGVYETESMSSYPTDKIIKILEFHDFIHLPKDILMSEYSGKYRDLLEKPTWWDRFFM